MRRYFCIIGSLLVFAFFQGMALAQNDEVVAKIGDKIITVSDFNKIIANNFDSDKQKMIENNPQIREAILSQYVQTLVVFGLANQSGFDKRPEVKEQLEFYRSNFIANEYIKREIAGKITVPENEIKAYYDSHPDEFKKPEMIRARHILVKVEPSASQQDKEKAKVKANDILKKIKAGDNFEKLADDQSDDPGSKSKGGDLGFFSRGRMVKQFEDAAFSLKPGETSGIVETQFGYHIIKVEEKKDTSTEPFDAVKDKISQKLIQERAKTKVTEFLDKVMKDAKVETHPEVLGGKK
jgi:peptidyl-prolyl cis-trans isomerase C